jgi:hypothetical protein
VSRSPADPFSYSYLLGAYLGDGYVAETGGGFQLIVTLDAVYPEIIEECSDAIVLSVPSVRPHVRPHPVHRYVRVEAGSKLWPELFPQHGPGRKHERPIVLAPWQREIVEHETWQFVRGLIHSDGCRSVNRFKTSCRRAESPITRIRATSSATFLQTSAGSSARRATGSG